MNQLALDLAPQRTRSRELPAIDRLRAVLKRSGIDWRYRALTGHILLRPMFGPHFGYQPMCGRYCCGDIVFERLAYREPKSWWTSDDQREHLAYLDSRRRDIHELWGAP